MSVIIKIFFQPIASAMNQPPPLQNRDVPAAEANLKNKQAFYELMIRDGYFLPKLSSKFVNQKVLQQMRDKKIYSVYQRQVVFRICVSPPPKQVLLQKFHQYLQVLNAKSGIEEQKENYPDKGYLVLMIATLSQGNDEIFGKSYLPHSSTNGSTVPLTSTTATKMGC